MNDFSDALRRLRGSRSVRDVAQLAAVSKTQVSDLESGRRRPTAAMAAALDQALGGGGELIARAALRADRPVLDQAAELHRGIAEALAAGPMTTTSLEEWEWAIGRHGRATRWRPEAELLPELMGDFADLQRLLGHRHPPHIRHRLTCFAAQMSGLMALTLLKVGDPGSKDWWRTGRAAAAAADDRATLSWMYAQEAYQLYYGGDFEGAVELAARAQHIAGGLPCVGPALAAPLEARAHAVLGRRPDAEAALTAAGVALSRLPAGDRIPSAFGYSESQLAFHAGNAWTHLRDTGRAREQHARALELYPASDHTDLALIQLDQAACLIVDGDPGAAAERVADTIVSLPEQFRSALIIYRAHELAGTVPDGRELRVLREVLALPPGE
jgi:transcriptional regulator with XRE-family HTH domain